MPLTIFDCKGISATRRQRIEAAVEAGGKHVAQPYEGWIAADPFGGGVRVLITGPQGFERTVTPDFSPSEACAGTKSRYARPFWKMASVIAWFSPRCSRAKDSRSTHDG